MVRRSALALKEKKSTEEPSAGERPIYIMLSLIILSPAPTARVAYPQIDQSYTHLNSMQSRMQSPLDHETHQTSVPLMRLDFRA